MIDPTSLRALIAVQDTGSVTAAAAALGYTAPNITQHLRKLERHFGTPLVERVGRGIALTPPAFALIEHARSLVDGLEQLSRAPVDRTSVRGTLRIGAFPTAMRGLLVPMLSVAADRHPELRIEPQEIEPEHAEQGLVRGTLEAVIHKSWGATPVDDRAQRELARVDLGVDLLDAIVPADHRLAARERIHLRELADDRWAITPQHDPYGRWIASHDPSLLAPLLGAYTAAEFQTIIRFAEAGLAVAVIPRLGRGTLPATVRAVPLADADAFRKVYLHTRPVIAQSASMRAVVAMLREALIDAERS